MLHSRNDVRITGLAINTKNIVLYVHEFELFDERAIFVEGSSEGEKTLALPDLSFFKGKVEGDENSFVYFSLSNNQVQGFIEIAGSRYLLSPVQQNVCALYAESIASPVTKPWDCLSEDPSFAQNTIFSDSSPHSPLITAKVALETDYETFQHFHNNVDTTALYLASLYGGVAAIYERDAGVKLRISFLRVWSTPNDPYSATTISGALAEFRNYWKANESSRERVAAQFLSVRDDISGGLAYIDALCNTDYGYSVCGIDGGYSYPSNGYVWDVHVTAHELGHTFGAHHSHNCCWNPAIDSCYTSEGGCFPNIVPAVGGIMSYCHIYGNGVNLKFHPKVASYIYNKAAIAPCTDGAISEIILPISPFSLGSVVSGSRKCVELPIYNPSGIPLKITNLHFAGRDSGYFLIANGSTSLTVSPKTNAKISVWFSPQIVGDRSTTFAFSDNTIDSTSSILLTGTCTASSSVDQEEITGSQISLYQNSPNPFSRATTIRYSLSEEGPVTLKIYTMQGKEVRTLVDGYVGKGIHSALFAYDDLPSGTYFYILRAGKNVRAKEMVIVR